MGFLDKAKAAANDLAAKADTAMANSGLGGPGAVAPDKLLRDLGVIAYLEATGRQAPEGERERIMGALREAEQGGRITSFALQTAAPPPGSVPPPPGAAAQHQAAPPPPSMTPPPPGASAPSAPITPSAPSAPSAPVPPSAPPPPPPSWAKSEE